MLQTNTLNDPIVEILRLAYRRGLALRQEQASKVAKSASLDHEERSTDHIDLQAEKTETQNSK